MRSVDVRTTAPAHRLCIAPMMERTDRHFRYLMRLIAPEAWLYTEMITARAIVNGDSGRLLEFDTIEHPVGVQLGGSDPATLAAAGRLAAEEGYDEINLNVGCPSDRVQAGEFGAALMLDPDLVAGCVAVLRETVAAPITVKTRIGVDRHDSYEFLSSFAARVAEAGCRTLIVHARKAWLSGLSPKENREIPPLDYGRVRRLKRDFPGLEIVLNGGLARLDAILEELEFVDGVMLGRAAYRDPMLVGAVCRRLFDRDRCVSRARALEQYADHIERELERGTRLTTMTRHLMGLVAGVSGARRWRRKLATLPGGGGGLAELRAMIDELNGGVNGAAKNVHRERRSLYNAPQSETRITR